MLSDGHFSIQKSSGAINGYFEFIQSFDKFYCIFRIFSFIGHYCYKMLKLKIKNWLSAGKQKTTFRFKKLLLELYLVLLKYINCFI